LPRIERQSAVAEAEPEQGAGIKQDSGHAMRSPTRKIHLRTGHS
jgi:hypothetical protein